MHTEITLHLFLCRLVLTHSFASFILEDLDPLFWIFSTLSTNCA